MTVRATVPALHSAVIPGLVPGIHFSPRACGAMDPGDKPRDDSRVCGVFPGIKRPETEK
jgi:hypothetical protein